MPALQSTIENQKSKMLQQLAWHGWRIQIPHEWNPVKIEGDYDDGSLLIADMTTARIGLRWKKAPRRTDPVAWARKTFMGEVGQRAADEVTDYSIDGDWRVSRLYTEPEPPGRDVWAGWSVASGRVLQVVYHARHREPAFANDILPTLADSPVDGPMSWSVFDLQVTSPSGLRVQWYKLNAGDLSLAFTTTRGQKQTIVRQIGPATLALSRQPLGQWVRGQYQVSKKTHRYPPEPLPTRVTVGAESVAGLRVVMPRKRRFFFAGGLLPRDQILIGCVDEKRNRIVIGQGEDETLVRELLITVGQPPHNASQ